MNTLTSVSSGTNVNDLLNVNIVNHLNSANTVQAVENDPVSFNHDKHHHQVLISKIT